MRHFRAQRGRCVPVNLHTAATPGTGTGTNTDTDTGTDTLLYMPSTAGKSTLIKTLIGIHPPTHGAAFIFGLDVTVDVADLQRIMGVCAQDDLLWLELTARQHLQIYAKMKAIPVGQIEGEVDRVLSDVTLTNDADNPAGTYSGGMKRRLSVGIASIGSPKIVSVHHTRALVLSSLHH